MDRFSYGIIPEKSRKLLGYCAVCRTEIHEGDEVYYRRSEDKYFCSQECAFDDLGGVQQSEAVEGICMYCGAIVTSEYESVTMDGDVFCDEGCLLLFQDIEEVEA